MKYTDFKELVLSIQWMRILCKNDSRWQDYLCEQDNSTPNQNIISSIIELLRRSLRVPLYAYVIDLQFVLVRFIIENVNGKNKNRIRQYVGSRVLDYAVKILKKGVIVQQNSLFNRDDPIDLTLEQQKKSPTTLEDKKHDSESESSSEENVKVGPKGVSALDGENFIA